MAITFNASMGLPHLVQEAISETGEHGATPREHHFAEERSPHIHIRPHDTLHQAFVYPDTLRADLLRMEKALWSTVSLRPQLLFGGGRGGQWEDVKKVNSFFLCSLAFR